MTISMKIMEFVGWLLGYKVVFAKRNRFYGEITFNKKYRKIKTREDVDEAMDILKSEKSRKSK